MIGSIPVQIIITFVLYGILYISIHFGMFAKSGGLRGGFRLMGRSAAVRREGVYIALFIGMVHTVVGVTGFLAGLESGDRLVFRLAMTALPMFPAAITALILALGGAGKKEGEANNAAAAEGRGKKRGWVAGRYALAVVGAFLFIVLFSAFSWKPVGAFTFLGAIPVLLVLIGFGLGQLLWLIGRRNRPKEGRKVYRPGFVSTVLFFYSIFTSVSLFLLLNSSLDSPREIGRWLEIFLQSTLYYGIVFITLRGSRIRRFYRTGMWIGWSGLTWQRVLMPIAAIVLAALPYLFMAWFFR